MIELKLSQGAKPGHGGILPAHKVTEEIAKIRHIEPKVTVHSPPHHKEFSTPEGLIKFIGKLRKLSGGKPVGFKLCIGKKSEFIAICKAIIKLNIIPDFISVDGGEGGTGAAPLEFSNSVGMPHKEGLAFVHDCLVGFDLRKDIKIFAAGKVVTGFHIFRTLCLGADATYSARAMMMAIGCIQALECNKNTCPTGVATQDPELVTGLDVKDKKERVHHYHKETIESFTELMAASGNPDHTKLNRSFINRRVNLQKIKTYEEIYPEIQNGCLLNHRTIPKAWLKIWQDSEPEKF
jgi:glutamate synthase domain-containing protein 2